MGRAWRVPRPEHRRRLADQCRLARPDRILTALPHAIGPVGCAGTALLISLFDSYVSKAKPWHNAPRWSYLDLVPPALSVVSRTSPGPGTGPVADLAPALVGPGTDLVSDPAMDHPPDPGQTSDGPGADPGRTSDGPGTDWSAVPPDPDPDPATGWAGHQGSASHRPTGRPRAEPPTG